MAPPGVAQDLLLRRCLTLFTGFDRIDGEDEAGILRRAMAQVGAVGTGRAEAGYLRLGERLVRCPYDGQRATEALDTQVRELAGRDGPVRFPRRAWGWAFGLRERDGLRGPHERDGLPGPHERDGLAGPHEPDRPHKPHAPDGLYGALVVSYRDRPGEDERLLLTLLVRQTAAALSTAAAHRRARDQALELRRAWDEREAIRRRLDSSLTDLCHLREVHDALARSAARGDGEDGIVRTLHRITGLAAAAEDRFGNLRAWAGPGRPDPYPKPDPERREELLREAARRPRPVRVRDRLVAVADPRGEVLGALSLVDPEGRADDRAVRALDHAATSLGLELAHVRELAEVELRLRRELVDDLLSGAGDTRAADDGSAAGDTSAYARAEAVGHDLHGPHHVIVVRWTDRPADDVFLKAVSRAATGLGLRILPALRADTAVLVAQGAPGGRSLHSALSRELGTGGGAIGVGASCGSPHEVPRSYREALRALEVRRRSHRPYGMTCYDELGLYRILPTGDDHREVERFVREWLGPLLDYDARHHTDLVETLCEYFDRGGNYSETAAALVIHRSTLRYRLQRIREIGGCDLAEVDSRLNLQVATRIWKILRSGPE
ncbi:PucR family transcriptional regulator [Streptomyces rapamycinicus]|uniref:Transcriptional regulator n=2 Tax=Streptomyces rapamycinicus TaxID=1226757 RepID=A0A0A0NGP9_STRRN|nr:helix-turn-helix domain-containing protein [Streptomyces rapamycinicus]AGP53575.1 transcriptional regulator [Streptomyces rapamycinicus NRRL 5491]MBB4781055.1 sugar diacid utilization regulator [Streptomyces rapamycinicus]RLV74299.1 transcriptional regulator [Streptomyces rapamycinicus NRRL 5491]UTO61715.1 helix-turn-helix domain-containing protein [Streptomyces rapamycinicus]UTP29668.1 helix-turn-helix domain-containing protein [Streptomyces rapamycinicus NRRL 5491]